MEYVRLGSAGLKVSRVALGMMSYGDPAWTPWVLGEQDALGFVTTAAEHGINFFDTADMYSNGVSERLTGQVLKKVFARREDYVLATKVYHPVGDGPNDRGLSRGHIMDAVDASLSRLQVDHIDLYQVHRWDSATQIEETMEALHDCVRAGKVRYLGASSMWAWQFAKAQHTATINRWTPFVTMQNHYNLLYREEEREMMPLLADLGVGSIPWSPLARGRLARPRSAEDTPRAGTDPAHRFYVDAEDGIVDAVLEVASSRGVPPATVSLAWLLSQPTVTAPIIGATKPGHVEQAAAATELRLSDEECDALEQHYRPRAVQGHE